MQILAYLALLVAGNAGLGVTLPAFPLLNASTQPSELDGLGYGHVAPLPETRAHKPYTPGGLNPYPPPNTNLLIFFDEFFELDDKSAGDAQGFFAQAISEVNYAIRLGRGEDPIDQGKFDLDYLGLHMQILDGSYSSMVAQRLLSYDELRDLLKGLEEYFGEELGVYLGCHIHVLVKVTKWDRLAKGYFKLSRRPDLASPSANQTAGYNNHDASVFARLGQA